MDTNETSSATVDILDGINDAPPAHDTTEINLASSDTREDLSEVIPDEVQKPRPKTGRLVGGAWKKHC